MINQTIRRITTNHQHMLVRKFPGKGKATVKVGDKVEAADIIAHCEVSAGQRLVKVAHTIGVGANSVEKYLVRRVGDRIYQGEILARRVGVLGLGKSEVKSPADGIINSIDNNGDIIVKFLPTPVRLAAGSAGEVSEVSEDKIVISTIASEVLAPIGAGRERDGTIKLAVSPTEFLLPQHIDASSSGRIIVGGALVERATIEKALTIGVHGIVVGGINYRDFLSMGVSSDIGVTVLVTGGFGTNPMGADIFENLKDLEGRFAIISGERSNLIIPELSHKNQKALELPPLGWRELKIGDTVRVLLEQKEKVIGKVTQLSEGELPSGIKAEIATVEAGNEKLKVAASNLEIIESQ